MAISWKLAARTVGVIALVAALFGAGYLLLRNEPGIDRSQDHDSSLAYTSPCQATPPTPPHADPALAGGEHTTTLRIASIAPQPSVAAQRLIAATTTIREQTSGRVVIKFYFGGVQGDADTVLKKMRIGMLQGSTFSTTDLAARYPDIRLYGLPFFFRTPAEVAHVREKLDAKLRAGLEGAGFETFCIVSSGFSRLMSKRPIRSHIDLLGRNAWAQEGDLAGYALLRWAGATPTLVPVANLMVHLQTQLVDVAPVTPVGAIVMQWDTQLDYMTRLPLQYQYWLLAIDRKTFERIAPADQRMMHTILNSAFGELDAAAWQKESAALRALADAGIKMVDPDPEWAAKLQKLGDQVAVKLTDNAHISPELYNQAQTLLEEYRATN